MPQAQIKFSYLGDLDEQTRSNDMFEQLIGQVTPTRDLHKVSSSLLEALHDNCLTKASEDAGEQACRILI